MADIMGRHAVSVIAGYLFFGLASAALFAASGADPRLRPSLGIAALTIASGVVFAAAAGFFASTMLPFGARAARHLAVVMAVFGALFAIVEWRHGSVWTQLVTVVALAPSAIIGGVIAEGRRGNGRDSPSGYPNEWPQLGAARLLTSGDGRQQRRVGIESDQLRRTVECDLQRRGADTRRRDL